MKTETSFTPASSQTVGPYFRIGLEYLIDRTQALDPNNAGIVEIRGKVIDMDGKPVPDAMVEFWSPACASQSGDEATGIPSGFRRVGTDAEGEFVAVMPRPERVPFGDGQQQAPHLLVLVFARGLLRNLITRAYFSDEESNSADPVLLQVPAERRGTLIAQRQGGAANCYHWDVILQGTNETVFFAW